MNLPTEIFGDVIVVHAPEELSEENAERFERHTTTLDRVQVLVDLDSVEAIDSHGLEALVNIQDELRASAGELKVVAKNNVNKKILEITRLDQRFEVFSSVIDGVKSFV